MGNQECKIRPAMANINSNEPLFYPYSVLVNKCSGNCNYINNPCNKSCVPDVVKNINIKTLSLMSRTNETRHVSWHKTCAWKCRLDASICNDRQCWITINSGVNVKNSFIMVSVMMDLFRILACVNVNVINPAMLVNTWIIRVVNAEKD